MTVEEAVLINEIEEKVCKKCKFYIEPFGICSGEVLPVKRAILQNVEGAGLCDKVKDFIKGRAESEE